MLIQKFGWWWDSLALKKPNIFANYYDALNNRIRNLRDPSLAQDAATKSYVDSSDIDLQQQITSNFNRSLRVNDSYISQLPSAQDRAWKGLGFDGAGQPKLQDPAGTGLWGYVPAIGSFEQGSLLTQRFEVLLWESTDEYWRWDGVMPKVVLPGSTPATAGGTGKGKWIDVTDATLRSNLGSGEADLGGALVSIDNATVRELAENNIFRKMTRADINTMLNTPGAEVDVEYALQALIDEGHKSILFPHDVKGIYILAGNVTVPAPVTLISFSPCVKPYTITDDSSFLNKGAVIRKAAGADYIFGPGTVPRFYGLLLDGRDSSRPLFNQENQQRGGMLFNCGIYRFLYGIGSYSYTSVQVGMSSICANQDGVYNLIDSMVFISAMVLITTFSRISEMNGMEGWDIYLMAPSATLLMVSWLTVMARQISRCLMAEAFSLGMYSPSDLAEPRRQVPPIILIFTWRAQAAISCSAMS
ncbi:tail fiber/spike domain-containing protein [Klebsiella pneumoniae]|uniref:tail fiber/spike domain-containing protein n=1 Tax=Klebsiella pneumoniae TaxID=573 RepID=UPI003F6897B2